jgi:glycosyltransferase involved in cell wall biosynthesis
MSVSVHQNPSSSRMNDPAERECPLLTVTICTRNRAHSLRTALQSVLEQANDRIEILVVDNGSTDETGAVLREFVERDGRVRVILETTPGVATARNRALKESRAPVVLFFDDDEKAKPGWLEAYLTFFKSPPSEKIGCVGGPYRTKHLSATPVWMDPKFGEVDLGKEQAVLTGKLTLPGGNSAYVRELALKVGGFDSSLVRYEDADLNLRIRAQGYEVWWLPQAEVEHLIDPTRFRFKKQMYEKFSEGCSVARLRVKSVTTTSARWKTLFGRAIGSPLLVLIQAAGALLSLCLLQARPAAKLALNMSRTAGVATEAWKMICASRSNGPGTEEKPA